MFGEKPLNLDRRWRRKIGKDQAKKSLECHYLLGNNDGKLSRLTIFLF